MKKKIEKFFLEHFSNLGIKKNNKVVVYSNLSKFGLYEKNLPAIVLQSLKKILGKKGTIIMPFYNLEEDSNIILNKKKINFSRFTGSLVKEFIKEKNIIRSKSLIHNHIGIGAHSKILNFSNEQTSLGKKSDFEYMKNSNFKLLLIGANFLEGGTYLHHLEAVAEVPYRK